MTNPLLTLDDLPPFSAIKPEHIEPAIEKILDVVSGVKAKKMIHEGDLDAGIIACGQSVGLARDIPSVRELFNRIISDAMDIQKKLN